MKLSTLSKIFLLAALKKFKLCVGVISAAKMHYLSVMVYEYAMQFSDSFSEPFKKAVPSST